MRRLVIFMIMGLVLIWAGQAGAIIVDFIEPATETGLTIATVNPEGSANVVGIVTVSGVEHAAAQFTVNTSIAPPPFPTIVMLEADGTVSDIIRITHVALGPIQDNRFTLIFTSDAAEGGLTPPTGPVIEVLETGGLQTVFTTSLPLFGGGSEPLTVRAQSDVEQVVPEPGTLLLIGSGLVGLGSRAWRRKRPR